MHNSKRQKTAVINDIQLKSILNAQPMLVTHDPVTHQKIEHPIPNLKGRYIAGQQSVHHYRVEDVIGVPGAFGVGWICERVSNQGLKTAVQDVLQISKSSLCTYIQKVIEACKENQKKEDPCDTQLQDAIKDFKTALSAWKNKICSENDRNLKACEQICRVCHDCFNRAGYSEIDAEWCHPCSQRLRLGLEDILHTVSNNQMLFTERFCMKTYFIPSTSKKKSNESHYVRRVQRELESLKDIVNQKVTHRNMAKILDVLVEVDVFEADDLRNSIGKTVCVIQELVEGGIDLWEWVADFRRGTHDKFRTQSALHFPGIAQYFFRQLMEAVAFLHHRNIFHYDIKIENIMISPHNKTLKLIDFGMGKTLPKGQTARAHTIECPNLHYLAPETRGASLTVPDAADIWGCGVVLLALTVPVDLSFALEEVKGFSDLLTRFPSNSKLAKRFEENCGNPDGPALRDLLSRMLDEEPRCRMSAVDVLQHPWVLGVPHDFFDEERFSYFMGKPPSPVNFTTEDGSDEDEDSDGEDSPGGGAYSAAAVVSALLDVPQEHEVETADIVQHLAEQFPSARFGAGGKDQPIDWKAIVKQVLNASNGTAPGLAADPSP